MNAPSLAFAAGLILIAALALPPVRIGLEASMLTHMLVQIPLLALAGVLIAKLPARFLDRLIERADPGGVATALVAVAASSYWMLPRALDASLADPWVETAKFVSLPLLVGLPLRLCWPRLGVIAAGFVIANVLSMWAAVGWLYRAYPARLCSYYLIDDQILAGNTLIGVAATLAAVWLFSFFVGVRTPGTAGASM